MKKPFKAFKLQLKRGKWEEKEISLKHLITIQSYYHLLLGIQTNYLKCFQNSFKINSKLSKFQILCKKKPTSGLF